MKTAFLIAAISGHSEVAFPRAEGFGVLFLRFGTVLHVWGFPARNLKLALLRPAKFSSNYAGGS